MSFPMIHEDQSVHAVPPALTIMPLSNGNVFRVTGPFWGKPSFSGGFRPQSLVMQSFDVFFDLRPNKRLRKQSKR